MNLHPNWLVGNSEKESQQRRESSPPCQLPGLSVSGLGFSLLDKSQNKPRKLKESFLKSLQTPGPKTKRMSKYFTLPFRCVQGEKSTFRYFLCGLILSSNLPCPVVLGEGEESQTSACLSGSQMLLVLYFG